ncbi:hypothetical protein RB597_002037 [Gaeumannomyces tritici]
MSDRDPLVLSYSHLQHLPRHQEALHSLKRLASLVKPIMRARGWKVGQLAEFYPDQRELLGLNVNRGQKILVRLRYPNDATLFLPFEQVADTMLHELSHIVHGPHDAKFHALWDQLRDEHEGLLLKGYTGEGFLSEGQRLGGGHGGQLPPHEARRLARAAAEKRRVQHQQQQQQAAGSGRRLGGAAPRPGTDMRSVVARAAAERRGRSLQGCGGSARLGIGEAEAGRIADDAARQGAMTRAEEDAANDAAIAQALWELGQEDEQRRLGAGYVPPTAENPTGSGGRAALLGAGWEDDQWACDVCTLLNPANYLCCDACGVERSGEADRDLSAMAAKRRRVQHDGSGGAPEVVDLTQDSPPRAPKPPAAAAAATASRRTASGPGPASSHPARPRPATWNCSLCGTRMEHKWWTCSTCGNMKDSS